MKPSLCIIGLGNPGASHATTRHNAGFLALDVLLKEFGEGEWKDKPKFLSQTAEARVVAVPILLVKPQTYMNRSGEAARKLVDFFKLDPKTQVLILSDDVDLPLGEVRLRRKGGAGTHNGLKSLVDTFGEEFPRIRIGIGPQPKSPDLATWVLSAFSKEEMTILDTVLTSLPGMVKEFVL